MPFPAFLLIAATLLPLGGLIVLLPLGRRMGAPLAGYVGAFFVCASFAASGWAMMRWLGTGNYHGTAWGKGIAPITLGWAWVPSPGTSLDLTLHVDSLTIGMFVTVTLVAMLVHIFAARSMRRDPRFARFFTVLALTTFAVLALLISGTLMQLLLLLELLGVCAAMLVGFRTDREETGRAASKMLLIQRIGDAALLIGMGIMLGHVGNLSLTDLWVGVGNAEAGVPVVLPGGATFPQGLLTAAGVALFIGAASRCAQFPLHVWAADVAIGVAPACTMIFSAALAVSGVYVVARMFPLFTPSARLFIAITGATTSATAALIACAQSDLKRILVFAAVSQLGLMLLGLGSGSWVGALFCLITYAFFQSLLFLCAGAVVRAVRGETSLSRLGGLFTRLPITGVLFAVAIVAACGVGWGAVALSGHDSQSVLLGDVAGFAVLARASGRSTAYSLLFAVPVAATLLVAFALARCWMLVFWGEPRDRRLNDHAREVPTLFWPLIVLAVMTILAGRWLGVRDVLEGAVTESRQAVRAAADANPAYRGTAAHAFEAIWPAEDSLDDDLVAPNEATQSLALARLKGRDLVNRWVWIAYATGILAAVLVYLRGFRVTDFLLRIPPLQWLRGWLGAQMYFDDLYEALPVALTVGTAWLLAKFDQLAVNGLSNLLGSAVLGLGRAAAQVDGRFLTDRTSDS
jgi:NADH:ubiquinone oxidoreductase subunit 5 (subunit L)/multisubunit Na+/H+ antiporter MnhA subunit